MELNILCPNKGCQKYNSPKYDQDTKKVHCSVCDGEMPNVSIFIVNQLKVNKKFRPKGGPKKHYAFDCPGCKIVDRPKCVNDKLLCVHCETEFTQITIFYAPFIKQYLIKEAAEKLLDEQESSKNNGIK